MTTPALAEQMEQLRQRLERIQANQQSEEQRFAKLDTMQEQVSAIEASATSKDRAVTVVAGPGGSVKSVQFTEDSKRLSPIQLSQAVMSTLQQAIADAARQQAAIVQEYVGDNVNIAERVMKTQEQLLGHALHADEDPSNERWSTPSTPAPHAPPPPVGYPPAAPPRPAPGAHHARQAPAREEYQEEELSVFGSEPEPPRRPSNPAKSSSDDNDFLRLYDGEDR